MDSYRYNANISGPSGNLTVNGTWTFNATLDPSDSSLLKKRGLGEANLTNININDPPYAIHNGAVHVNSIPHLFLIRLFLLLSLSASR